MIIQRASKIDRLKDVRPELVDRYNSMSKEELVEEICGEVLDLLSHEERVQLFMNECTNVSKTFYSIENLKEFIEARKEDDINTFCSLFLIDKDSDEYILKVIKERGLRSL